MSRYYSPDIDRFLNEDDRLVLCQAGANLFIYARNQPIMNLDDSGNEAIAISGAMVSSNPIGLVLVGLVCAAYILLGTSGSANQSTTPVTTSALLKPPSGSGDINWNFSKHFLKGSAGHGGHDWGKFQPPKDPEGFSRFILPLLKKVVDEGKFVGIDQKHRIDGVLYVFEKYFPEYDDTIVVRVFQDLFGSYHFSNAWPKR